MPRIESIVIHQGPQGAQGAQGPPSLAPGAIASDFDQTIRQTGPSGGLYQLLFRRNKEAYLNDRNDVDATGASDMGATITTYLNEFAANHVHCIVLDENSTYLTGTTIVVPAAMTIVTGTSGYSGYVKVRPNADNLTMMRLDGNHTTVQGIRFDLTNRTGVVGLTPNNSNQIIRDCHFYDVPANGVGMKGGGILYLTVTDTTFSAIRGYGIDLLNAYAPVPANQYYGVNVGTFARCYFYDASGGAITAARMSGIWTMEGSDIEGTYSAPAVVSDSSSSTYGQVLHTYFELTGGANQAMNFGNGKGIAAYNDVYGSAQATVGGYGVKAANYIVEVHGNYFDRFETGVVVNSPSSALPSSFSVHDNQYENVTTPVTNYSGRFQQSSGSMTGVLMKPNKGYQVIGSAIIGPVVLCSDPVAESAINLGLGNTFHLSYSSACTPTVINGTYGMRFTVYCFNANTTFTASTWGLLSGVNETAAAGTIKEFVIDYSNNIHEIAPRGHLINVGNAPTIADAAGAGTTPTVSVSGTDTAGLITVTTGTTPAASATVATVTFGSAFGAAPKAIALTPAGANSAALSGTGHVYEDQASRTATAFVLKVGSTALAASTTYKWNFQVIG